MGGRVPGIFTLVSYCILGFVLCVPRLATLGQSYWHDEISTVVEYVRAGPGEILAGAYLPNNHELFSLLGWATSSLVGESEIALRLWSVIPFIAGVVLVTAWLHARVDGQTALLYLLLATVSPLLFDLSRQARGYGLAFLAMSLMVVLALEADRTERSWPIAGVCIAGVAGTCTLPVFGVAFAATGLALLVNPTLRRRMLVGLGGSMLAIVAWWAPHADDLLRSSRQEFGLHLEWWAVVSAPFDRLLLPAFLPPGSDPLTPFVWRVAVTALGVALLASSPLLRNGRTALILGSGVVATAVVIWAARLYFYTRFVSFLFVPLFMLLASGMAQVFFGRGIRLRRLRVAAAIASLVLIAAVPIAIAESLVRLPVEAHRDAARLIREHASPTTPVFADTHSPRDLVFYLGRPVQRLREPTDAAKVCTSRRVTVVVVQQWVRRPVDVPCLQRAGVRHHRVRQYARGGEIDLWFVPGTARAESRATAVTGHELSRR